MPSSDPSVPTDSAPSTTQESAEARDLAMATAMALCDFWDIGDHSGPGGSTFDRASYEEVAAKIEPFLCAAYEQAAKVAEEHQLHIDIGSPQDHMEPPFRCCVAQAIRALIPGGGKP